MVVSAELRHSRALESLGLRRTAVTRAELPAPVMTRLPDEVAAERVAPGAAVVSTPEGAVL